MTLPNSFALPDPLQGTRSVEGSPNEQGLVCALPNSPMDIETGETEADSEEKKTATKRDINPVRWLIRKCNIDPQGRFIRTWDLIVLLSCLIAVSVDPFFFYLPVINEDRECLTSDKRLKITATCLRSVLDFISLSDIILRFICPFTDEDAPGQQHGQTNLVKDPWPIAKRYLFSRYFLIDILAILPAPQVAVPIIFSDVGSQTYWKMFLSGVVLFQYVPRVLRIFRVWRKVDKSATIFKALSWLNAGNYIYLYLFASYVLGAFWYFSSIQRLMDCWHLTCKPHKGCNPSSFLCDHDDGNHIVKKEWCPVKTPDSTAFDFGIFHEALQSVKASPFLRKCLFCSWWGVRNLSSLGQNLQTSPYEWENVFAIFITILGLLPFLYFSGNVQDKMISFKEAVADPSNASSVNDDQILSQVLGSHSGCLRGVEEAILEIERLSSEEKELLTRLEENRQKRLEMVEIVLQQSIMSQNSIPPPQL